MKKFDHYLRCFECYYTGCTGLTTHEYPGKALTSCKKLSHRFPKNSSSSSSPVVEKECIGHMTQQDKKAIIDEINSSKNSKSKDIVDLTNDGDDK